MFILWNSMFYEKKTSFIHAIVHYYSRWGTMERSHGKYILQHMTEIFYFKIQIWAKLQQSGSSKFGGNLRVIYKTRWFNKCRLHVAGNSLEAEFLMKFDFFSLFSWHVHVFKLMLAVGDSDAYVWYYGFIWLLYRSIVSADVRGRLHFITFF